MSDLTQLIKQAAIDAVNATSPTTRVYGTVTSLEPLTIKVENRFKIKNNMIELTSNVKDHIKEIELLPEDVVIDDESIRRSLQRKRKYKIYNGLKVGEKVLMLRVEQGQKYIVFDRVVE